MRRQPVQARSTARVQRMLEAAAQLINEVGYEELTTSLIAERAKVSIGSLYQFFPDKRAIVQELYRRHMTEFLARVDELFRSGELTHWWDAVGGVVDIWVEMARETPAILRVGDAIDRHLLDPESENDEILANRLLALLGERFGVPTEETLRIALLIAIATGDELVKLAFRRDPNGDEAVLTQAKVMIHGYLAHSISGTRASGTHAPQVDR